MKRFTVTVFAAVLLTGLLASCGPKPEDRQTFAVQSPSSSPSAEPTPTEEKAANVKIVMSTQKYEGDNIVEIPYFEYSGEKNEVIDEINTGYNMGLSQVYTDFQKNAVNGEWIEIRSFPFTSKKYLQVISTYCIFPTYGTDGSIISVNYDIDQNRWITIPDAMAYSRIDETSLLDEVDSLFTPEYDGQQISEKDVKTAGFLIKSGGDTGADYIQFLLEITLSNAYGDSWKTFYSYTPYFNELYPMNKSFLYDETQADKMNPPLFYEFGGKYPESGMNNKPNDAEIVEKPEQPQSQEQKQLNEGEIIAPGVIYNGSVLEGDPGDNLDPYNAAKGLYYRALTNIYDSDDYSVDNPMNLEVVGTYTIESEKDECYLFSVTGSLGEMMFAVSYEGNIYQIGDGIGRRGWGNIND